MNKNTFMKILLIITAIAFSGCLNKPSKTTNIIKNKVIEQNLKINEVSSSINNQIILNNAKIRTTAIADDGYYIFGNIEKSILIAKLTFQNKFIWIKKYSSTNEISLIGISEDNGFILRGEELVQSYKDNALIVKIDYDGNIIWDKIFGTTTSLTQVFKVINSDNGYMAFGMDNNDLWILKLNKDGSKVWEKEVTYSKHNMYYFALRKENMYVVYSANTLLKKPTIKVTVDTNGNITKENLAEIPIGIKKEHDKNASYKIVINKNLYQFIKDEEYYIIQKVLDTKVKWEYKIKKEKIQSSRSGVKVLETKDGGCIILHAFREGSKNVSSKIIKLDKNGILIWGKYFAKNILTKGLEIKENHFAFIGNDSIVYSPFSKSKSARLIFLNQSSILKDNKY